MRVKPKDPNAVIRDPHTKRALPAEGAEVPENIFWTRRLRAGEVVRVELEAVKPAESVPVKPAGGEPAPTIKRAEK